AMEASAHIESSRRPDAVTRRLVVVRLDREYALPAEHVLEVVRMVAVTPLPEAPPWLAGVINLRGRVVPLIDLRIRLGLPPVEHGLTTAILILQAGGTIVGLIADVVTEMLEVGTDAIEPPGELAGLNSPVSELARAGDRLILILDAARLCDAAAVFA
ncbi:MAG TPA: chemotaxis protein CheW, partial [Actinomycetota bacterium]